MDMEKCTRCGTKMVCYTMSRFNTDLICEDCVDREQKHLKYEEAARIEEEHVKAGDYNFEGIGCPPELYLPAGGREAPRPIPTGQ